jgi:hypothetical protein
VAYFACNHRDCGLWNIQEESRRSSKSLICQILAPKNILLKSPGLCRDFFLNQIFKLLRKFMNLAAD